jgi:hypothetical protein
MNIAIYNIHPFDNSVYECVNLVDDAVIVAAEACVLWDAGDTVGLDLKYIVSNFDDAAYIY